MMKSTTGVKYIKRRSPILETLRQVGKVGKVNNPMTMLLLACPRLNFGKEADTRRNEFPSEPSGAISYATVDIWELGFVIKNIPH